MFFLLFTTHDAFCCRALSDQCELLSTGHLRKMSDFLRFLPTELFFLADGVFSFLISFSICTRRLVVESLENCWSEIIYSRKSENFLSLLLSLLLFATLLLDGGFQESEIDNCVIQKVEISKTADDAYVCIFISCWRMEAIVDTIEIFWARELTWLLSVLMNGICRMKEKSKYS